MNYHSFLKQLFLVLFPPLCVGCRRRIASGALCSSCEALIEIRSGFVCPKCGRRLPEIGNTCHKETKFVLAAASFYENPVVKELVHALKYQRIRTALEPLSKIVKSYLKKVIKTKEIQNSIFIIIPVPLHAKKERERGFNQAALIARIVSDELKIKIHEDNLIRTKKTNPQIKTKNYKEREKNVAGCFGIKNPALIAGRNIILVDDVFTSGATMKEAVRVLKKSGARKIIGFVMVKT